MGTVEENGRSPLVAQKGQRIIIVIRHRVILSSILAACMFAFGCQPSTHSASDPPAMTSLDNEIQQLSAAANLTNQQRGKARVVLQVALHSRSIALRPQATSLRVAQLARLRTQARQALFTIVTAEQEAQVQEYIEHSVLFSQS